MKNNNTTNILMANRSSMPPLEEYIEEIRPLWKSCWLSNDGLIHNRFHSEMKKYLDVENLEFFVNGHMALELTLAALNLEGEVITTPFTFIATSNAIVRNGLTPVYCDINPDDFNIDVDKIESLITEKTSAIVPVHIYGNPCDVEAIERIAKKHNLKVVYDAAQAFGVKVNGKSVVNYGDASIFSFHATKAFHTIEGGAAIYRDGSRSEVFRKVGNFGSISNGEIEMACPNAKMNEFQAAMGLCNLRHIDEEIAKREERYQRYKERIAEIPGIKTVPDIEGVEGKNHTYLPTIIDSELFGATRDEIVEKLVQHNIYAGKYFAPLLVRFDYYSSRYDDKDLPVAKHVEENILALPIFADMDIEEVDRVCDVIEEVQKKL